MRNGITIRLVAARLMVIGGIFSLSGTAGAQAASPVFLSIKSTPDGVIMKWASESNALYGVEYAHSLSGNTEWLTHAEGIPAQGMSTVWADIGDETGAPPVVAPYETPQRFYRVRRTGSYSNVFAVTITNPPSGSVTGDILIGATAISSNFITGATLLVDGIAAEERDDLNAPFAFNTCTLANGLHQLFVIAANESGKETTLGTNTLAQGFGVSSSVAMVFNNFISSFRAKDIWNGDNFVARRYSANFDDFADWTLSITNSFGQTVRTLSGTGFNMAVDWDGNDNAGAPAPLDFYAAVLSASVSSQSPSLPLTEPPPSEGPPTREGSVPSRTIHSLSSDGAFLETYSPPFPPLPKGMKLNVEPPKQWRVSRIPIRNYREHLRRTHLAALGGSSQGQASATAGSQTTAIYQPGLLQRTRGSFGIAYQDHHPSWQDLGTNVNWPGPHNGINASVLLGNEFITPKPYGPLRTPVSIANGFKRLMQRAGFYPKFIYKNDAFTGAHLRKPLFGGSNVFNNVNLGFLIGHGVHGVTPDFRQTAAGVKGTYYPIWQSGTSVYDWVSLAECDFGSQQLRWMAILACNMLHADNCEDMINKFVFPMNEQLHFVLSGESYVYMVATFGRIFAGRMVGQLDNNILPITDAWFLAAQATQPQANPDLPVIFRVVYWPGTYSDTLISPGIPEPEFGYEIVDFQAYP